MFDNRPFQLALALSLTLHSLFLFAGLPRLNLFSEFDKRLKNNETEIIYYQVRSKPVRISKIKASAQAELKDIQKTLLERSPLLEHKLLPIEQKPQISADIFPETLKDKPSAPFTVELSNIAADFKGKPLYLNYFQTVRERIRQRALNNYPKEPLAGDVTISFVLESSGKLKSARIINERSSPNQYLRAAALKSVQEASPYPSFPKPFKQPEITFNILISFELHKYSR